MQAPVLSSYLYSPAVLLPLLSCRHASIAGRPRTALRYAYAPPFNTPGIALIGCICIDKGNAIVHGLLFGW